MNKNKINNIEGMITFMNETEDYKKKIFEVAISLYVLNNSDLITAYGIEYKNDDIYSDIELVLNTLKKDNDINNEKEEQEYKKIFNDEVIDEFLYRTSQALLDIIEKNKDKEKRLEKLEKDNKILFIAIKFLLGNE